jgi:hypothetical protein
MRTGAAGITTGGAAGIVGSGDPTDSSARAATRNSGKNTGAPATRKRRGALQFMHEAPPGGMSSPQSGQ